MRLFSPYPDKKQELMLNACLEDNPENARRAWAEWRIDNPVEDLDTASQRLLPLLYFNLNRHGIVGSEHDRYASVARYVWYENQLRTRQFSKLLQEIKAADIRVAVLKGFAIGPLYYPNPGLRPASDIDILVPALRVMDVSELLEEAGWTSSEAELVNSPRYRTVIHAAAFRKGELLELDLHWRVLNEYTREKSERDFWDNAVPFMVGDTEVETLSGTDHLLHTLVHALRPNSMPPIRWVTDSAMILRSTDIDWDRFLFLARDGGFTSRASIALTYLREKIGSDVPKEVLRALTDVPPSWIERSERRLNGDKVPSVFQLIGWRYLHYRRIARQEEGSLGFLAYLQSLWGADTTGATVKMGVDFVREALSDARGRKAGQPK